MSNCFAAQSFGTQLPSIVAISDYYQWAVKNQYQSNPPNGIDDILNEVCNEAAGYESDESDEGAW